MSRNTRVWLAILVLVVGIPVWAFVAVTVMEWAQARLGPLPFWGELAGWVALGIVWIFPLRGLLTGVAARGSSPRRFEDDPK